MVRFVAGLLTLVLLASFSGTANAKETIRLHIGSGHSTLSTYVNLLQHFFVPEVSKRVADRTNYEIVFTESYGGSAVKTSDTLERVKRGDIDIGGYCFCFEPSNLPLHAFQVMLPFGSMDPITSLKIARDVYDSVPFMTNVFESKYRQKLIALMADSGQNLATNFDWTRLSELKGRKIAGAGLNLKWVEYVGAIPIQSSLREAYSAMSSGTYDGYIIFPGGWLNYDLFDLGKYYTEVGFGAVTWYGLTINKERFESLPKDVQTILIEVAREYEALTGTVNAANYRKNIEELKARGVQVRSLPNEIRKEWATALAPWPQQMATELDARGLPASQVLSATLAAAERAGHVWPVRYQIK